jgi:SAM-dependent methyltransferase
MKKLIKRMLTPIFYVTANRKTGLRSELAFWEKWIRTKGSEWPEDFKRRLDPHSAAAGYHLQVLERIGADTIHILDVGAGPLTTIEKRYQEKTLIVKACDPLADEYKKILDRYSIKAPVVTEKCDGERLGEKYQSNYFDWVNAQNCVDHSSDPVKVIREMIQITKAGGFISLCHEVNEAKLEAYRGLHQWNFYESDGNFMVSGKYGYQLNLTDEFKKDLVLTTWIDQANWIYVIGRKGEIQ